MPSAGPTRREFALLFILLFALVYVTRNHLGARVHQLQLPSSIETYISPSDARKQDPEVFDTRLSWNESPPSTEILAHVPGWTIFDKLYLLNGTLFVVNDDAESIPETKFMISKGLNIENGAEAEAARLPDGRQIRIISTKEAHLLFGTGANIIDGVTFLVNDPPQFITHYYHWSAELWFGFWRTYSSLDPSINADGQTKLPPLDRIMFSHVDADHWRDYASMNQWVVRSSFPSLTFEFIDDWRDRARMGQPFVFNRVILADRSAAMLGFNYQRSQRTASLPFALPGSVNWWMTIRNNVVQFAGLGKDVGAGTMNNPVITYISRQEWGRRMLRPEDHEKLVRELHKLRDERGYEVNIVRAETMSRVEQIQLAARTTILMGVHGNGLTSLIWMKPSPRSTVIEFFYPQGFAYDYEYTTRALGMVHYGFWGDSYFTSPSTPLPQYPEGFQGNSIPIDGELVARLCVERLTLSVENDD